MTRLATESLRQADGESKNTAPNLNASDLQTPTLALEVDHGRGGQTKSQASKSPNTPESMEIASNCARRPARQLARETGLVVLSLGQEPREQQHIALEACASQRRRLPTLHLVVRYQLPSSGRACASRRGNPRSPRDAFAPPFEAKVTARLERRSRELPSKPDPGMS